jgi:hypothetical protein
MVELPNWFNNLAHSHKRIVKVAALAATGWGSLVAWHYHQLGLTLTHYDARGHLVVARRIFDSITPGWQQIGAVWLPLPHLLNAMPVQIDFFYRTGASGVAISIASFAIAAAAIAWIVQTLTGSTLAALAGVAVFALNPNVLYLQSTPMTEPLLLATTTVAIAMLMAELSEPVGGLRERSASTAQRLRANLSSESLRLRGQSLCGLLFALACLTRYEAWPVTVAAIAAVPVIRWWQRRSFVDGCRKAVSLALFPAIALVGFSIFSRVVIGEWFVSGDFFVPENKALGDPLMALKEIGWGTQMLSGSLLAWTAGAGLAIVIVRALIDRDRAAGILPLALVAMAAVPWSAFEKGHPFRIRYMVPMMAVEAIGAGAVAGAFRRSKATVLMALAVLALAVYELRPFDAQAPMVLEAQWDRPNLPVRARVTACLDAPGRGEKIMASMGSLGHYMQEASEQGFALRDFLHEGNGDIWLAALDGPRPFADWILIEEKAEGGDMLAKIARARPSFLDGYARVCDGAGLALYQRQNLKPSVTR